MTSSGETTAEDLFEHMLARMDKLEKLCCDPGRSPRMADLRQAILKARELASESLDRRTSPDDARQQLEAVGAKVGALQIACCAPKRMPLYAEILESLNAAQIRVSKAHGQGH